jgi:DNA-binding transcriptional LysR family regulator
MTLASPAYLKLHGTPRTPDELRHHECLAYSVDLSPSSWVYPVQGREEREQRVSVRSRIMANNGSALMQAAARGLGITRQPDFIAAPFLARGEVVPLLAAYDAPPLGIYAVLPSNRYIPHRVKVLMDFLAAQLQA